MKNNLKRLSSLLVCVMLLFSTFTAFADELEINLAEPEAANDNLVESDNSLELLTADEGLTMDDIDLSLENVDLAVDDVNLALDEADSLAADKANEQVSNDREGDFEIDRYNGNVVELIGYYGPGGNIAIPYGVTEISYGCFKGNSSITGVTIPATVKKIGHYAFEESGIQSIVIPGSVKEIGDRAFRNCDALVTATVMEGVTEIPYGMFMECDALKTVTLPDSVEVITEAVFRDCPALESVTLGQNVKQIEMYAFADCASLKEMILPNGVKSIGEMAFQGCTSLETVRFPEGLENVEIFAFYKCSSLKKAILPQGLKTLKSNSFNGCTSLVEVSIPGSVKVVEDNAFQDCASLEKVAINEGVMELAYCAFMNCPKLMRVTVPESVIDIGDWALGCLIVDGWWGPHLEGFTICGKAGTAAEEYANENGFEFDDGTVKPKSITITNGKSKELETGKTLQLKTSLKPRDAKTTLTWKSSNENVATVSAKGLVKAVAKGKATVTVTTANGKKAKITIKVIARKPSKVTITNGKKATVAVGKTLQLKTKLSPANAETKLTWKSSNTKVATVSGKGLVRGVKAGKAKITVRTANGKSATITITVK